MTWLRHWRQSRTSRICPWLKRRDQKAIIAYLGANPDVAADRIWLVENGSSSWMRCDYRDELFFLSLQRPFEKPQDWDEATQLALMMACLDGEHHATVRQTVTLYTTRAKGRCILEITPGGFILVDRVDKLPPVELARGTF